MMNRKHGIIIAIMVVLLRPSGKKEGHISILSPDFCGAFSKKRGIKMIGANFQRLK